MKTWVGAAGALAFVLGAYGRLRVGGTRQRGHNSELAVVPGHAWSRGIFSP